MKNITRYLVILLLLSTFYIQSSLQEETGQSFMFTRPAYQHLSMQQVFWNDFVYNKKGDALAGFQITSIAQRSMSLSKTARYFLINGKNELLISGDDNKKDRKIRDVRAEWLDLPKNFRGNMSIKPRQRQLGFIIEYHQDIKKFVDVKFVKDYWVSVYLPFISVENDLNLSQRDVFNKGTQSQPRDIIEAFRQKEWRFGKIDGERSTFEIAELNVKFGKAYVSKRPLKLIYYSGLTIPIGRKQNPEFLFDPVVGNNGHIGIVAGGNMHVLLNRDDTQYAVYFFLALESTFLIRNKQLRTLDIKDRTTRDIKPWSRYMKFVRKGCSLDQAVPGVNVLTQEVVVRPFNIVDFTAGWRFKTDHFEVELSYNIWGHGDEFLKLHRPLKEEFGIVGTKERVNPETGLSEALTADDSTIDRQAAGNDEEFISIAELDFDFESGASRSALNHKVQIALAATHHGKKIDSFIGAGAFIDIPQKNGALRVWGIWVKLGGTF